MTTTVQNFGDFFLKTEIDNAHLMPEDVCINFKLYYEDFEIYSCTVCESMIALGGSITQCCNELNTFVSQIKNAKDFEALIDLSIEWELSFDVLKVLTNYLKNK